MRGIFQRYVAVLNPLAEQGLPVASWFPIRHFATAVIWRCL